MTCYLTGSVSRITISMEDHLHDNTIRKLRLRRIFRFTHIVIAARLSRERDGAHTAKLSLTERTYDNTL